MLKALLKIFHRTRKPDIEQEVKIKTEFPPYLFYDKDIELAKTIRGLLNLGYMDQKPFGPYFYYKIDEATTSKNILDFLDTLPPEFQFQFRKLLDPSAGLASTSVMVQSKNDRYLYHYFSHGQSKIWQSATRDEILKLIMENKKYQDEKTFRTYRKSKDAVEGSEGI